MKTECKHFDELPAMLTATELAGALGISKAGAYTLIHSKGFPTLRIGKRLMPLPFIASLSQCPS